MIHAGLFLRPYVKLISLNKIKTMWLQVSASKEESWAAYKSFDFIKVLRQITFLWW